MTGNVGRALRYRERIESDPEYRERIREKNRGWSRKHYQKFGKKTKLTNKKFAWHKNWNVTDEDVKRNLEKVEQGQDLDMPLAVLDGTFKQIYRKETEKKCRSAIQKSDRYKEHLKEWKNKYFSRPEVKRRLRLSMKKYMQKPGVRERQRILSRKHYIAMSALIEMYQKEFKEIKNSMKDLHWNERRSKVCTILRHRHRDEYRDLMKSIK